MPSSGVQKCARSEEHTSELQSHDNLVCRLLLEKKKYIEASAWCSGRNDSSNVVGAWARTTGSQSQLRPTPPNPHDGTRSREHDLFFFFNNPAPTEISPLPLHDALPINDAATPEIYTLSLHDALPISVVAVS